MSEEWGPWIEHDGRGFPKDLMGVQMEIWCEYHDGEEGRQVGTPRPDGLFLHWDWEYFGTVNVAAGWCWARVLRYRIRKPRGLMVLEGLLETLPIQVDA